MDRIEEKNSCTAVMFNLINKNGEKIISLGWGGGRAGNCVRKQGEINLSFAISLPIFFKFIAMSTLNLFSNYNRTNV